MTIFTFTSLSIFIILLIGFIWFLPKNKIYYCILFAVVTLLSTCTTRNYTSPSQSTYTNTDFHIFEHLGFGFTNTLSLVDSKNPTTALWDDQEGKITLKPDSLGSDFTLNITNYLQPFYRSNEDNIRAEYDLLNKIIDLDISEGFEMGFGNKSILKVEMKEVLKDRSFLAKFIRNIPLLSKLSNSVDRDTTAYTIIVNDKSNTSKFAKRLNIGYPLLDIVTKATTIETDVYDLIDDCLLIRAGFTNDKDIFNDSKLYFFPSPYLLDTIAKTDSFYIASKAGRLTSKDIKNNLQFTGIPLKNNGKFYVGLGISKSTVWQIHKEGGTQRLMYEVPKRYHLKKMEDKEEEGMFITSNNEEVVQNDYKSGYYFPLFKNKNTENHVNASLKYFVGSAKDSLKFRVIDQHQLEMGVLNKREVVFPANQEIVLSTENFKNQLKWLFQFHDLKASNLLQTADIEYFFLFLLGSILIILLIVDIQYISKIEIVVYLLMFCFLTIRVTLLWRMSTFPPIEDIDAKVFEKLRSIAYFQNTWKYLISFFIARLVFAPYIWSAIKSYSPTYSRSFPIRTWYQDFKRLTGDYFIPLMLFTLYLPILLLKIFQFIGFSDLLFLDVVLLAAIIFWGIKENFALNNLFADFINRTTYNEPKAFIQLGIGVLIAYFILLLAKIVPQAERFANIAFPLFIFLTVHGLLNYIQNKLRVRKGDINWAIVSHVVNWILCFLWLGLFDAGFSIVFLLFTFIAYMIKNLVHNPPTNLSQWGVMLLFLVVAWLFVFYTDELFESTFTHSSFWYYLGISLVCLFLVGISVYFIKNRFSQKIIFAPIVFAIILIIAGLSLKNNFDKALDNYSYIKYRASIHSNEVADIMVEEDFASTNSNKLLQAAQNQWFIAYFQSQNWFNSKHFDLKPHFRKGVSYITQTTDLVILRYVIGEHSEFLVVLLICLFLLLATTIAITTDITLHNNTAVLYIVLLLFSACFFIWLTATNRFIFFGQDFPLISLQSKLTLIFTFLLLLAVILFSKEDRSSSYQTYLNIPPTLAFLPTLLLVTIVYFTNGSAKKTTEFNIAETVDNTRQKLNQLNAQFINYQKSMVNGDLDALDTIPKDLLIQKFTQDKSVLKSLEEDTTDHFTPSVYKYFVEDAAIKDNPVEILHLRRPESRYYEMAMNNQYYLLKSPDEQLEKWQGSLMAATSLQSNKIKPRNGSAVVLRKGKMIGDLIRERGTFQTDIRDDEQMTLPYNISNIVISVLPAGWSVDNRPIIMIRRAEGTAEGTKGNFAITRNQYYYSSTEQGMASNFGFRLLPNDYLNLYSDLGKIIQFKIIADYDEYLAKNIWINGKQQMFYPLGEKMLWCYNFANLISNKYITTKNQQKNVNVSIDYALTENSHETIHNYYKKSRHSKDFSVIAMDGMGRVRMMLDYKPRAKSINPNNIADYNDEVRKFYLESNRKSERQLFGNRCLMRIDNGPGSTIKPIMYSAASSGYNLDWNQLQFTTEQDIVADARNNEGKLTKYGGQEIGAWKLRDDDYLNSDYQSYLIKSYNSYHSLIMFLGSYPKKELSNTHAYLKTGDTNYESSSFLSTKRYQEKGLNFPLINYAGKNYVIKSDRWPEGQSGIFSETNSVLANKLFENYQLPIDMNNIKGQTGKQLIDLYPALGKSFSTSNSSFKIWSYPEHSHFYQIDRGGAMYKITGLRQSTVGGYPVNITPLKMAEMGGKLISMNHSFKASIDTNPNTKYTVFNKDNTWQTNMGLQQFHQQAIFESMNKICYIGTARGLLKEFIYPEQAPKHRREVKRPEYHFYAKTGTITGSKDARGRQRNDKHLMLIISKENLHEGAISTEQLKNNRFYTLYFSFYSVGSYTFEQGKLIRDIIYTLQDSYLFDEYMKNETK